MAYKNSQTGHFLVVGVDTSRIHTSVGIESRPAATRLLLHFLKTYFLFFLRTLPGVTRRPRRAFPACESGTAQDLYT